MTWDVTVFTISIYQYIYKKLTSKVEKLLSILEVEFVSLFLFQRDDNCTVYLNIIVFFNVRGISTQQEAYMSTSKLKSKGDQQLDPSMLLYLRICAS